MNNKVFYNVKWIIGCRIIQSVLNLLIGMISARYLGPSNYGLIGYAASVVAFVVPVMQLGLRATLVQEYIVSPEKEGQIIGTSLVMNLLSSLACICLVSLFAFTVNKGEKETVIVCMLYSISLIFQAVEMIQYWFQAKYLSQYPSMAMLGGYLLMSVYKIYLLYTQKNIYWFALAHSVEYCVAGVVLIITYKKIGQQKIRFSQQLVKQMFAKSKYYIISGMMVTIFQNTDQIMIKLMLGDAENGYYMTAINCAGLTSFVFAAMVDSVRPAILESKKKSIEEYNRTITIVYSIIIYLALLQCVGFTLFAKLIVMVLYGDAFKPAIPLLRIVVWYTTFSYIGTVRNIWILSESKQNILWIINLSGVVINIVLNVVLIIAFGTIGAAIASVLTQFFTNVILGYIIRPIRPNNRLLLAGIKPQVLLEVLRKLRAGNIVKNRNKM